MLQVSTLIWNEIAETQPLKNRRMSRLMRLDAAELPQALDKLAADQESRGALPRATLAFATVAPLLLENEAISRYFQSNGSDFLRDALPNVLTMDEAVALATMEYRLIEAEQTSLRHLLSEQVLLDTSQSRVARLYRTAWRVVERRNKKRHVSPARPSRADKP
jgi:hypothetical protein